MRSSSLVRHFDQHAAKTGIQLRMTRLGHVQRGGTPGSFDRILASRLGAAAIDLIGRGQFGCLVGLRRGGIVHTPLSEVAGRGRPLDTSLLEACPGAGDLTLLWEEIDHETQASPSFFASGFGSKDQRSGFEDVSVLDKPFCFTQLVAAVRQYILAMTPT